MINIRSEREIELLIKAGRIVGLVHKELAKTIKAGISTKEIDDLVEKLIRANDATPSFKGLYDFPASACISINEEILHGIPSKRILKEGDIVTVDIGACYKGYHADSAWTYGVGEISDKHKKLLEVTKKALYKGIEMAKEGNRVGDIANAIEEYVYGHNYTMPKEYTGHGVGTSIHEDPMVPNFGKKGTLTRLKKGMCIAIEPMVFEGKADCYVKKDNWTVVSKDKSFAAHFEHTVIIDGDNCIITTSNNLD